MDNYITISDLNECKKIFKEKFLNEEYHNLHENLEEQIEKFCKEFNFSNIHKYKKLNAQSSTSDEDGTYLAHLIYVIVWGNWQFNTYGLEYVDGAWKSLIYGGETINTYDTLIGENYIKIKDRLKDSDKEILEKFKTKYLTIGNFMVLPKIYLDNQTINQIKGCQYKDLMDIFLYNLFDNNSKFYELVKINKLDKKDFCIKNFLEPYFDIANNYKPVKIYRLNKLNKDDEITKEFVIDYVKKAISIIDYRAERICAILKERLQP